MNEVGSICVNLTFAQGTLLIDGPEAALAPISDLIKYDERVRCHRAKACDYAELVTALRAAKVNIDDRAKAFAPLDLKLNNAMTPREHQKKALQCWKQADYRGVISMPTGSGKTYLAVLAMKMLNRPVLVVVPTIELLQQWASVLERFFGIEIGMLGGGSKEVRNITVSTYDSAVLQMEFIGNRFALVVFDECHHLPGPVNRLAASMCIAPFRLGLSATPERTDGGEELLWELIGPQVCEIHIDELEEGILAPYDTRQLELPLDDDEQVIYDQNRACYTSFLKRHGITFNAPEDWGKFIGLCARMPDGKAVLDAYRTQKRIARRGKNKLRKLWQLLLQHRSDRVIIFTADNDSAYEIGRSFLLPVITHRTKAAERKEMLDNFRSGKYPALVTSKVLNEGVDVPEAGVGIIVSGSSGTREHVQRLGRILRSSEGKRAVLYELISAGTSEIDVGKRRRQHRAYQRPRHYGYGRRR